MSKNYTHENMRKLRAKKKHYNWYDLLDITLILPTVV